MPQDKYMLNMQLDSPYRIPLKCLLHSLPLCLSLSLSLCSLCPSVSHRHTHMNLSEYFPYRALSLSLSLSLFSLLSLLSSLSLSLALALSFIYYLHSSIDLLSYQSVDQDQISISLRDQGVGASLHEYGLGLESKSGMQGLTLEQRAE